MLDFYIDDIFAILFFCLRGFSSYQVDLEEIDAQAARIGSEAHNIWIRTLARAKEEIEKEDTPRKW